MVGAAFAAGWAVLALAFGFAFGAPGWVIRRSTWVLGGLALVTFAATLGGFYFSPPGWALRIDASTEPLLPLDDPMRAHYAEAIQDFGDDEIYSVAIHCGDVFSFRCLDGLERATARLARLEGVRSVSSLADVTSYRWVEEREWIEIAPLFEEVPRAPEALARLRERTLSDPVYRKTLVSEQGDVAAINVSFRKMSDAEFIASGLDARIVDVLEEEFSPEFAFSIAGRPHVKVHVYRGIVRDLLFLVPAAVFVMALVLFAFFQSMRGVWLPIGVAVAANLWTFGIIGWSESPLSLLTGLLAPMLIAMGCVYGVHVFSRYEEAALDAASPEEAALATLLHVRMPAVVAGLTTMIGFAALRVTEVPAVFQLGTYAILGVASATCLSLIGIPAVLSRMPLINRRLESQKPGGLRLLDAGLSRLAGGLTGFRRPLLGLWATLIVGAVLAIPAIVIDTDYLSYFAESDPIRVDFETVNGALAGVVPVSVVIDGGEPGTLRDPDRLRAIEQLDARLRDVAGVSRTISVLDSLRQLNRAFHQGDPEWERLPATRPAVTEFLFMMPKSSNSRLMTVDHARANLVVRTGAVGSSEVLALSRSIDEAVQREAIPDVAVEVSGNAILLSRSADGIARSQPLSIAMASIAIALLVSLALGSIRLGLIAMIPNVIPVLIFFGALGVGAADLSVPTSLIGCMALGVAIDDTVHWLSRYRAERISGRGKNHAIQTTLRRVGRPIAITSLMLGFGFLVITGSRFATLQSFGWLSAFTMGICLLTDLLLLPLVVETVDSESPSRHPLEAP